MRNEKTRLMYLPTKKNALTHQIFQNDSSFRLQSTQKSKTGKDADTGRGLSVNFLWVDEAGGVDLEKLESSIFPTTSTTFMFCKQNNIPHIILLSGTANGRTGIGKKFYDLWKKVEPPNNLTNKSMGGYLLHWKDIPGKDQAWYDSWKQILSPRKIHQEIECLFLGTENSLFTDDQVVKIQEYARNLSTDMDENYTFVCPSGHIGKGTFYDKIKSGHNYLIGVDMAKGRSQDYTAIQIIENESLRQVFEFKDNRIQNDDFVKLLNNICLTFLSGGANICLSIESNMTGSAVINDLIAMNPMYKMLIYRNTIGPDISKSGQSKNVQYHDCPYGVEITSGTRDLLINYIFKYIDKNIDCIQSKYLMNEIESLQIDNNGRIEGIPHDDTVFALGHCLLLKYRARPRNLLTIFNACNDIRHDPTYKQHMNLSLFNYDEDKIKDIVDNNDRLVYNITSKVDPSIRTQTDNELFDPNLQIENATNLFGSYTIDSSNGTIDMQSLESFRNNLMEQTRLIQQRRMELSAAQSNTNTQNNNNNSQFYEKVITSDIHNNDEDPMGAWIDMVW